MDINALMSTLLSSDSIQGMSSLTGTQPDEVKTVLAAALPQMMKGAEGQAVNAETAESFVGALADHAKVDTSDIAAFLQKVDLEDGGKIVGHLLGADTDATTERAASVSGLGTAQTGSILSAIAPLLMSLLGQQTQQTAQAAPTSSGIGGLMGSLLGGGNMGGLMLNLLGGGGASAPAAQPQEEEDDGKEGGGLLATLMNLLK